MFSGGLPEGIYTHASSLCTPGFPLKSGAPPCKAIAVAFEWLSGQDSDSVAGRHHLLETMALPTAIIRQQREPQVVSLVWRILFPPIQHLCRKALSFP
jgi:hypothetical protein